MHPIWSEGWLAVEGVCWMAQGGCGARGERWQGAWRWRSRGVSVDAGGTLSRRTPQRSTSPFCHSTPWVAGSNSDAKSPAKFGGVSSGGDSRLHTFATRSRPLLLGGLVDGPALSPCRSELMCLGRSRTLALDSSLDKAPSPKALGVHFLSSTAQHLLHNCPPSAVLRCGGRRYGPRLLIRDAL